MSMPQQDLDPAAAQPQLFTDQLDDRPLPAGHGGFRPRVVSDALDRGVSGAVVWSFAAARRRGQP